MGGRFTEIPQETFEQIVVDAGVLLRKFDLFDPDYDITPDIITATTGGVELSAEMEISDLGEDVDNCPEDTKELARLTSWNCRIASTAIGSSPEIMQMILGAADLSGDIDVIPRAVLELSDFKDLWWVGDRVDGGLLAVHIANALSISGLSLQTTKAQKGQFGFEIQAHVSIYDLDRVPMTFYVMAPGAWEITGLVLEDFFVEKGVPTQVPVKFLMGDGSVMEPSDYGHHFTYSATLPAGGTLTEDGVLTLVGKTDSVQVTVRYQKGETVMSETVTVGVLAAYPVNLVVKDAPIHIKSDETASIKCVVTMSDGEVIEPTDTRTGFTYRLEGFPEEVEVSNAGVITPGGKAGDGVVHVAYSSGGHVVTASAHVTVEAAPPEIKENETRFTWLITPEALAVTNPYVVTLSLAKGWDGTTAPVENPTIDWGDGTEEEVTNTSYLSRTHSYVAPGEYIVTLRASQTSPVYTKATVFRTKPKPEITKVEYASGGNTGADLNSDNEWTASPQTFRTVFAIGSQYCENNKGLEYVEQYTGTWTTITTASLGYAAFRGCTNLKTFKSTKTSLIFSKNPSSGRYDYAQFSGCTSLETVDLSSLQSVPALPNVDVFTNTPDTCKILVPAALLNDFKTATNWSVYANRFVGV